MSRQTGKAVLVVLSSVRIEDASCYPLQVWNFVRLSDQARYSCTFKDLGI
jgi:hypothetical protein